MSDNAGAGSSGKQVNVFNVEKLLSKRVRCGRMEFLVKWEGHPESQNTWEPESNLGGCQELLDSFNNVKGNEKRGNLVEALTEKAAETSTSPDTTQGQERHTSFEITAFDRGLEPDKILGATERDGELLFLMKWKETDEADADIVPARVARYKCPHVVIKYFEDRLKW